MSVITLTSDMGLKDYYVAAVKGAIISQNPEANIIDISHEIKPFDIFQAAFVVKNCFKSFPKGTVHVLCVDDEPKSHQRYLAVVYQDHYFIASDSGILTILFNEEPDRMVEIALSADSEEGVFVAKDILAKAAGYLSRGGTLEFLGKETSEINRRSVMKPTTTEREIQGSVIHIDSYGNAITNIDRHLFSLIGKSRGFDIYFGSERYRIGKISKHYGDVAMGEKCAVFGESGYLEIALNKGTEETGGSASQLLGLHLGNTVRIEFANDTNR